MAEMDNIIRFVKKINNILRYLIFYLQRNVY